MLEAYATLSFAAGQTGRIELGALVTGVTPRHPGVLVKTVTTLDVLSGGRAWLGIGAAWNEEESRGLGIPFPPMAERFERLEETLRIAHRMWAGDREPFQGRHYRLEQPLNVPNALRRPHPPILVGGSGERKTLRLVARYGDACNLFEFGGLEALRHKLEVLRGHCAAEGRPYDEIQKTTFGQSARPSPPASRWSGSAAWPTRGSTWPSSSCPTRAGAARWSAWPRPPRPPPAWSRRAAEPSGRKLACRGSGGAV
jgi:F420-dependent oxidoreductase-like protein